MANKDPEKRKRNIFKTSNKYQEQIILLTLLPAAIMFLFSVCVIFIAGPFIAKSLAHVSFSSMQRLVNQYFLAVLLLMFLFLVISLVMSFLISRNMVGAFGRIIFELDEIIAGRTKKIITTRPEDTLSREILKRVNYLVKHYVVSRHEKEKS